MKKPIQKKQKIHRRPMMVCQTTEFGVGLLRMTVFNNQSATQLDAHEEGRNPGEFKKLVFPDAGSSPA